MEDEEWTGKMDRLGAAETEGTWGAPELWVSRVRSDES